MHLLPKMAFAALLLGSTMAASALAASSPSTGCIAGARFAQGEGGPKSGAQLAQGEGGPKSGAQLAQGEGGPKSGAQLAQGEGGPKSGAQLAQGEGGPKSGAQLAQGEGGPKSGAQLAQGEGGPKSGAQLAQGEGGPKSGAQLAQGEGGPKSGGASSPRAKAEPRLVPSLPRMAAEVVPNGPSTRSTKRRRRRRGQRAAGRCLPAPKRAGRHKRAPVIDSDPPLRLLLLSMRAACASVVVISCGGQDGKPLLRQPAHQAGQGTRPDTRRRLTPTSSIGCIDDVELVRVE